MVHEHTNLTHALKEGELVSIEDVESGLKCGCTCPACGEELIARKGNIKIHHFAHKSGTNCEFGYETSLHLMAKDILSKAKEIKLPEVILTFDSGKKPILLSEPKTIPIDRVELEKKFDDIIPDIIVYSGEKKLFVEIFVTHKVDDIKIEKVKNANISMIEINLRKKKNLISYEELQKILIDNLEEKKWIHNAMIVKYFNIFKSVALIMDEENVKCPQRKDKYVDRNFICDSCEYCIQLSNDYKEPLICTGKSLIKDLEDFKIPYKERLKEYNDTIERQTFRCPKCKTKLKHRYWKNIQHYFSCPNYPDCDYSFPVGQHIIDGLTSKM